MGFWDLNFKKFGVLAGKLQAIEVRPKQNYNSSFFTEIVFWDINLGKFVFLPPKFQSL